MPLISLRAGPLEMAFDASNAFLRHVRVGEREVVRGIFGAVRDRNWDTVAPQVQDLLVKQSGEGFEVRFRVVCREGDIDFAWHGEITGTPDGTVRFVFDGVAASTFWKNRIGLCVLHPIAECAGAACTVEQTDGRAIEGSFPRFVAPHQPFKSMRSIRHGVLPGLHATVRMEGEAFEMEDQRNWTDASFKTYSTPLDDPFPVRMEAGARVRQVVTIALDGNVPERIGAANVRPNLRIAWEKPMLRAPVGLGMATHGGELSQSGIAALRNLRVAHLRVDVEPGREGWLDRLREADRLASSFGAKLVIAAMLSDDAEREVDQVLTAARDLKAKVGLWLVFHAAEKSTSQRWISMLRAKLDALGDATPLAAGANAYFAELNRNRPAADTPAFPCYSINPQVHAFDDLSLVETLEAQRATVESARELSAKPVVISPITLRPRFNPNATDGAAASGPETDARQSTDFAAAWTVGSLGRLLPCEHVHCLTFFETHGPRGVMADDGSPYPMAKVFAALHGFEFACDAAFSHPLMLQALALQNQAGARRLVVASFSDSAHAVRANAPDGAEVTINLPAGGVTILDLP